MMSALQVAQHYGFPTPLLDYTHSLEVAAFFATGAGDRSKAKGGAVGVVYYFRAQSFRDKADAASGDMNFAASMGVRLGQLRTIEPKLDNHHDRIARQRGLFIDGFDNRHLQRSVSGLVYFRQIDGDAFEDPRRDLTAAHLLEPDSRLQELANSITGASRELGGGHPA